ncbi:MAG: phosphotransferase [Pasteurella oralis]|uniref:phosphotransferase n=1 Tax=Pasteurella oralis TaxID=1071947 RepID=UPI002702CB2F|nr:phosphotransferase [Pasteurella oralis]
MLTDADKRIIARDTDLPGLIALLNNDLLLDRLRKLPQFYAIRRVDIQYLRYKPNNSCAGTLRIVLQDGSVNYYYAKALTPARFAESWANPKRQKLIREADPNAPLALFDLYVMLLHPAYDRGIRYLGWLINNKLRHQLFDCCPISEMVQQSVNIDILRYKPERRLVAKITQNKQTLVVRTIKASDFSRVLTGAAFGMAQGYVKLLGSNGHFCSVITSWQEGESLCPETGFICSTEDIYQLATLLAQVHSTSYSHPITYQISDEIQSLKGVQQAFQHILPEYVSWFTQLVARISKGLSAQSSELFTLIHGDFSLDQVVKSQDKQDIGELYLLDWDRSAHGNPLLDLATLQARLELQVIEGVLPVWQTEDLITKFLSAYQAKTQFSLEGLSWFVASAMLRLAIEPFRKRSLEWEQHTLLLLQRVENILSKTVTQSVVSAEKQQVDLSFDSILFTLTDITQMQDLLKQVLPEQFQGVLESAQLIRYKIQRRALIEYQIESKKTKQCVIGKYRSKGLDKRSFQIQKALWQNGFDQSMPVSVPQPLSILPAQRTWLQVKVSGRCIGDMLIPQNQRLAFLGCAVAQALRALHQSAVEKWVDLPVWTAEQELQILRDRLMQVQLLLPAFSIRIAKLLSDCEKIVSLLSKLPVVSVHRDFYQDQILERSGYPGYMVLLDLDLVCQGHAALDAGNYLAHIQEFAIRQYANPHALSAHQQTFINTFLTSNSTATAQDIEVYTILSLARHIYLSTQFPDRQHTTETLISLCEEKLNSHLTRDWI